MVVTEGTIKIISARRCKKSPIRSFFASLLHSISIRVYGIGKNSTVSGIQNLTIMTENIKKSAPYYGRIQWYDDFGHNGSALKLPYNLVF